MYIVKKRRVSNDCIYASCCKVSFCRITTREVEILTTLELIKGFSHLCTQGTRETIYLLAGYLSIVVYWTDFEGIFTVINSSKETAFKECGKSARALRRTPEVSLQRRSLGLEDMVREHV